MTRRPTHNIEDAPEASRPLLEDMLQFSPTGRLLNIHAQMAHAPAVLDAYTSIRRATGRHGTLDLPVRDEQLAEAFAYLALTVFTSYFLNYAATEPDIPAGLPRPEGE